MKRTLSFFTLGLMIGLLVATIGFAIVLRSQKQGDGNSASNRIVLKLGHSLDASHPVHIAMEFMKSRLAELSGGTVVMDIYPGSVLGSETECISQLQTGSLAMTKTSAASIENFITEMSVFGLPYLFRDEDHYWKVLSGDIGRSMLLLGEKKFLRGLCYYDAGSRNFYTKTRPVITPDDLKGMKIRVMNSKTSMDMVEAMGAAPTPIAWGELYTALAQGTVDGAENNMPSFTSNKHYEICKHFTLDGHTRVPDMLIISTKVWENLPKQVQAWIQQAADESTARQRTLWADKTAESIKQAEANGVTIYQVDTAAFAAKVKSMLDDVADQRVFELVRQIREVR